jgi:hypothetical protein
MKLSFSSMKFEGNGKWLLICARHFGQTTVGLPVSSGGFRNVQGSIEVVSEDRSNESGVRLLTNKRPRSCWTWSQNVASFSNGIRSCNATAELIPAIWPELRIPGAGRTEEDIGLLEDALRGLSNMQNVSDQSDSDIAGGLEATDVSTQKSFTLGMRHTQVD